MQNTKRLCCLVLLTVLIAFFIYLITTFTATVNYEKVASYIPTWNIKSLGGLQWTVDFIHMIKADNLPAFYIEHGTLLSDSSEFTPSELSIAE